MFIKKCYCDVCENEISDNTPNILVKHSYKIDKITGSKQDATSTDSWEICDSCDRKISEFLQTLKEVK